MSRTGLLYTTLSGDTALSADRLAHRLVYRKSPYAELTHIVSITTLVSSPMSTPDHPSTLFAEFSPVDIDEWTEQIAEETGRSSPEELLTWASNEGITMPAYLQANALEQIPHVPSQGSVSPLAETESTPANRWSICQQVDHPSADTANQFARQALEGGASALRIGRHRSSGQKVSPTLDSSADLAVLLDGLDLTNVGLHLAGGATAPILYGAFRNYLDENDTHKQAIRGSVEYDPVAVLARGDVPSAEYGFDLAANLLEDTTEFPDFQSAVIDSGVYHNGGASAVEELAFTLGALAERLARETDQATPLNELLDSLLVRVPISTSYFVEIAKLRAFRLLVPQVIEPFLSAPTGTQSVSPNDFDLHAQTSQRSETLYDPYSNLLRGTTEAFAAVAGGCDVLTVRPYNASLSNPSKFGNRMARNTQLILRHETHADQVADPAAGSYYVETLTDQLAQKAWERFQKLEANGGIVEALREGTVQQEIEHTRRKRTDAIDDRERVLIGTTHYPNLDENRIDAPLPTVSETSDSELTSETPSVSSPVASIRDILRDGTSPSNLAREFRALDPEVKPLPTFRVAADVESIRLRTERYAARQDEPPQILIVPIGSPAARSARANFARNFLGVGGFRVEEPLKFDTAEEAANKASEIDADVVVLCSSNAEYGELAPALNSALESRNCNPVLLIAGSPKDVNVGGVGDGFIHQGSSLKGTLKDLQSRLGMAIDSDS